MLLDVHCCLGLGFDNVVGRVRLIPRFNKHVSPVLSTNCIDSGPPKAPNTMHPFLAIHDPRIAGASYMTALQPGGARGYRFQL